MQRSAGILLPISSLPSSYGIGCFSQEAYDFVDWLKEAGQTYWQILPLGVTSYGDSPYQSFSAFAGNPYFISLDALVEEGVLTADECKKANFGRKADDINYSRLYTERSRLLRLAYSRSDIGHNEVFTAFCEKNKWWLDDFALFMAVKDRFEGKPWMLQRVLKISRTGSCSSTALPSRKVVDSSAICPLAEQSSFERNISVTSSIRRQCLPRCRQTQSANPRRSSSRIPSGNWWIFRRS